MAAVGHSRAAGRESENERYLSRLSSLPNSGVRRTHRQPTPAAGSRNDQRSRLKPPFWPLPANHFPPNRPNLRSRFLAHQNCRQALQLPPIEGESSGTGTVGWKSCALTSLHHHPRLLPKPRAPAFAVFPTSKAHTRRTEKDRTYAGKRLVTKFEFGNFSRLEHLVTIFLPSSIRVGPRPSPSPVGI
jgi:hypothetical protein